VKHDWLEGICKYDVVKVLKELIFKQQYFSLDTLNYRIQHFNYGYLDSKNKPSLLCENKLKRDQIKASASEMLCLLRYLPLMIAEFIPENTKVWNLFLLMRKIVYLLLVTETQKGTEIYLNSLIQEHHSLYQSLFDKNLPPKFHVATHYGGVIADSGPVVHFWNMREEAKHRISKQFCKVNNNRVDLLHSLALNHQMILNERFLTDSGFEEFSFSTSHRKFSISNATAAEYELSEEIVNTFKCYDFVNVQKVHFRRGYNVIIDLDENDDDPIFSKIRLLLCSPDGQVKLLCHKFETEYYDEHFGSYCVMLGTVPLVVDVNDLSDRFPLNDYFVDGKNYITVRQAL
jgi:hypothetical protein